MMKNRPFDKAEESTRCYLSEAIDKLPDEFKKIIERYYEVVDLLKEEMLKFNSEFGNDILKYRKKRYCVNLESPYFCFVSIFEYDCLSYVISSRPDEPLYFDYSDNFTTCNAEILASFHTFLSLVRSLLKRKTNIGAENE